MTQVTPRSPEIVRLLEQHLPVPCKYGNWWVARKLVQESWKKKPYVLRDTTLDLRDLPFTEASRDIIWRRVLTPEMIGRTCHHFDKNSSYLAANRGAKMGIGDPVHLLATADNPIVPGLPGIYRIITRPTLSTFDGCNFPAIIEEGQEWITSDVLLFALQYDYDVQIEEAYVFEDYAKILDAASLQLWNARQALKPVNTEAYDAVKGIALVLTGSFATGKNIHLGIDLIHPNWWADSVGKARVNILANLLKYGSPVLIKADGLFYITADDNPRSAVPGILERQTELGGYKHVASFTLTEEMYQQSLDLDALALNALFRKQEKH